MCDVRPVFYLVSLLPSSIIHMTIIIPIICFMLHMLYPCMKHDRYIYILLTKIIGLWCTRNLLMEFYCTLSLLQSRSAITLYIPCHNCMMQYRCVMSFYATWVICYTPVIHLGHQLYTYTINGNPDICAYFKHKSSPMTTITQVMTILRQ